MRADIHPKYQLAKVVCGSCHIEFEVGSTQESLRVDGLGSCRVSALQGVGDVTGDGLADLVLRRCPGAGVGEQRLVGG